VEGFQKADRSKHLSSSKTDCKLGRELPQTPVAPWKIKMLEGGGELQKQRQDRCICNNNLLNKLKHQPQTNEVLQQQVHLIHTQSQYAKPKRVGGGRGRGKKVSPLS